MSDIDDRKFDAEEDARWESRTLEEIEEDMEDNLAYDVLEVLNGYTELSNERKQAVLEDIIKEQL